MIRAVILAAGVASRLRPLTNTRPKCLLPVGGLSILERTIESLRRNHIDNILLVTGYRAEQIREFMEMRYPGLRVTYIHNADYETTNNIYSLWMTKAVAGEDPFLLLDSDIVFDPRIIGLLVQSGHASCLAVRSAGGIGEEEIKVRLRTDGSIAEIGKHVDPGAAVGESIGIELFGGEFAKGLFDILDHMVGKEKQVGIFYEAAFQRVIDRGAALMPVDVGALRCIEIDTAEDLERAAVEVLPFLPPQ